MSNAIDSSAVDPLVTPAWLVDNRAGVSVFDVRWYLDGRDGFAAYTNGHIEGAVFVDLDRWVAAPATVADGRHPFPSPEVFAEGMGAVGIGPDTTVVAYDDRGGTVASRLVWMLRILGHPAALLDGGLPAWPEPLETGTVEPEPATFAARPWPSHRLIDADGVAEAAADPSVLVIDSRSGDRYRGETEPIDARAGHIPGAHNVFFEDNMADGRFLSPEALRSRFAAANIDDDTDVVAYCGSGVSACHNLIALEAAGITSTRLYPGSWSQWAGDPSRPCATGADPA